MRQLSKKFREMWKLSPDDRLKWVIQFLKDIAVEDTYIAIGTVNKITDVIGSKDINKDTVGHLMDQENLYFLWNVDNKEKRRSNYWDITDRKYIFLDIDIRKDLWLPDHEDITPHIEKVKKKLDEDEFFSQYSYIVNSWNGMHVYYIDEYSFLIPKTEDNHHHYTIKKWLDELCDAFEQVTWYQADKNAAKLSQIIRLPWTWNAKPEKKKKRCDIFYKNKINNHNSILEIAAKTWLEIREEEEEKRKEQEEYIKTQEPWYKAPNVMEDTIIYFSDWTSIDFKFVRLPDWVTKPCKCINPAHNDKHASAYIWKSVNTWNYFCKCSGCSSIFWNK